MNFINKTKPLAMREFVILIGIMMALVALSIDAMLPALSQIQTDLNVENENSIQLIVSFLIIGLAIGQLFYGPLSDSIGRKRALYIGFLIYIFGCLLSILSKDLTVMLAGRVLQGFGVAAPRVITVAIVRDKYEGRMMAKVMSYIMMIFILIPMLAPSMGQAILLFADWRWIFGAFVIIGSTAVVWYFIRQPETLPEENRIPFTMIRIINSLKEIASNKYSVGYTIITGLISGAFLGYLSLVQPILQVKYNLGETFPLFFAIPALAIGSANFLNGKLVMKYGMEKLTKWALTFACLLSLAGVIISFITSGFPPFIVLMAYLVLVLFCVGIIWSNLNALAMKPLGHIAGIGAAVVGSVATFISIPLGIFIGQLYNDSILPLVAGFLVLTIISLIIMMRIK